MKSDLQNDMFEQERKDIKTSNTSAWGTFRDSLRAPVHRWFTYPAGFSYKAVEHSLDQYGISEGDFIYDPFMGSGTTNLTAKTLGINSVGVEAHPFVINITKSKLHWNVSKTKIISFLNETKNKFESEKNKILNDKDFDLANAFPALILKCYKENTLCDLLVLRELINKNKKITLNEKRFIKTGVTALLRSVSSAATGWPYIAPNKIKSSSENKIVLDELFKTINSMLDDIDEIKYISSNRYKNTKHSLVLGDSRDTKKHISNNSINHIFTSPPYLNNFDYSDRTRLELYFWGEANSWGDISKNIRTKLMTSATTQIKRNDERYNISELLKKESPEVAKFVAETKSELSEIRKTKGGKKSYDLMVSGYFNDMYPIMKDCYRVLKKNSYALFVLGDSAPYGVYVPTDELIGKLGVSAGFKDFEIEILRERGGKWKDNPQRHGVMLRESIVKLRK